MGFKVLCHVTMVVLLSDLSLCSGSTATSKEASNNAKEVDSRHSDRTQRRFLSDVNSQKDITNPVTTIPTIIPAPYASSSSTTPTVIIPTSNPGFDMSPQTTVSVPVGYPTAASSSATPPPSLSGSWCIASEGASQAVLQVALDYACGYGRADCSAIQPGGRCYEPNSIRDHASYAFNEYYQKNPMPSSCNFGGTAVVTSTDPSSSTCRYPSTSTSSSILNTTNSVGARVFGAVPSGPTTSSPAHKLMVSTTVWSFVIITTLSWSGFASKAELHLDLLQPLLTQGP